MKKLYALLLAAPMVLAGCTKDTDECNGLDNGCRMSATWSGNKVVYEYEEGSFPIKSTETVTNEQNLFDEVTFYSDGTYEAQVVPPTIGQCEFCSNDGTWVLDGDQIILDGGDETYTLVAITATELIFRDDSYCGFVSKSTLRPRECDGTATFYYTLKKDGPTEVPD